MPFWGVSLGLASSSRTFLGLEWKADELENGICELLDFLHGLFAVAQVVCGAADQHGPCECLTIPESHWQGRKQLVRGKDLQGCLVVSHVHACGIGQNAHRELSV